MKKIVLLIIICLLSLLSACSENIISITQIPLPTFTKASTNTPVIISTITSTPTFAIPDYMQEFIKKGYDKQVLDGTSMHVVMREETIRYGEIKWKGKIIQAWTSVSFFLDDKVVDSIVINHWYDTIGHSTYILESSGGTTFDPTPLSEAAVKALREGISGLTPDANPIVTIKFGSTGSLLTDAIFNGAFPLQPYTGENSELIHIPGLGDVLPATSILIQESMVIPTP